MKKCLLLACLALAACGAKGNSPVTVAQTLSNSSVGAKVPHVAIQVGVVAGVVTGYVTNVGATRLEVVALRFCVFRSDKTLVTDRGMWWAFSVPSGGVVKVDYPGLPNEALLLEVCSVFYQEGK